VYGVSPPAAALERYRAEHGDDAIAADPVAHFLAYRRSVGCPAFQIPAPVTSSPSRSSNSCWSARARCSTRRASCRARLS